jgi:hypothetical protein
MNVDPQTSGSNLLTGHRNHLYHNETQDLNIEQRRRRTLLPWLTLKVGLEGNKARGYYDMAQAES